MGVYTIDLVRYTWQKRLFHRISQSDILKNYTEKMCLPIGRYGLYYHAKSLADVHNRIIVDRVQVGNICQRNDTTLGSIILT